MKRAMSENHIQEDERNGEFHLTIKKQL